MLRCPECRSRRVTLVSMREHVQSSGHKLCACSGYHYSHRPGSPYCYVNPRAELLHALRASSDPLTVMAEWAWDNPGELSTTCPF